MRDERPETKDQRLQTKDETRSPELRPVELIWGLWSLASSLWSLMSWIDQPIFFVDFEGSRASGILEFGVVEVHRGEIASVRTRLCRAMGRVREEDAAVHGLREAALAGCAPFSDEWRYFSSLREL